MKTFHNHHSKWLRRGLCRVLLALAPALAVPAAAADPGTIDVAPASAETASPAQAPPVSSGGGISAQGGSSRSLGFSSWISRGHSRLSLGAGWGSTGNENYALLSAGFGYFLLTGLEAGLDGEAWVGNSPQIYKVTPGLRYVFPYADRIFPYVGVFYRRLYYSEESPLNSVGGRAGAYVPMGKRLYGGAGVVYENYLDCDETQTADCSVMYPEFTISFTF